MADIAAVRFNERIKLFAQTLAAAGAALSAWAAVQIYTKRTFLDEGTIWLMVGLFAIYSAWFVLGLLQEE